MVKQNGKPRKPAKKPRLGRPSLSGGASPGQRSPIVGLRLPPAELAAVDKLAKADGVKRSEMVRRLLLAGIEAHKPQKPR